MYDVHILNIIHILISHKLTKVAFIQRVVLQVDRFGQELRVKVYRGTSLQTRNGKES